MLGDASEKEILSASYTNEEQTVVRTAHVACFFIQLSLLFIPVFKETNKMYAARLTKN